MRFHGGCGWFKPRNIYLGQQDGEAVAARLVSKAESGIRWSAEERVQAILLPLMKQQRPLPAVLMVVAHASEVLGTEERLNVRVSLTFPAKR